MHFAEPYVLVALVLALPALGVWMLGRERKRTLDLARFAERAVLDRGSSLPSVEGRRVALALTLAGVGALLVALARPQSTGSSSSPVDRAAGDVLFVLDLSRSMEAGDGSPTRLASAKSAVAAIARRIPQERVGLVVFGGGAFLQLPPTLDRSTFEQFLAAAATSDLPDPATNFEPAAEVVAAAFTHDADTRFGAAVVLSDGEDVEGKLETAINTLRGAGVRTYAVGVGSPAGAEIIERDSTGALGPHRDFAGQVVTTRLVESNLRRIAERTGGRYVRWDGEASVKPITDDLATLRRRAVSSTAVAAGDDRFQWPLAIAFLMLLAAPVGARARLRA